MEAIDLKLMAAIKALPEDLKKQVLDYIKQLQKHTTQTSPPKETKTTSKDSVYGNAKEYAKYIPENLDQISVSENSDEYLSGNQLISSIQNLPHDLQAELFQYLDKLKVKAQNLAKPESTKDEGKKKFEPKPGFGGGKGFFILKEGWDEPLTEEFKDYM